MYRNLTFPAALLLAACSPVPKEAVAPDAAAQFDAAVEAKVQTVETSLPVVRLEGRAEANLSLQGWMEALDMLHSVATVYGWPDQTARDMPHHVAVRILAARGLIDVSVPLELLKRYAGRYELEPGLIFDVEVADGTLAVRLGDQPRLTVYPESRERFYYREVNAQLTFLPGDSPGTDQLILHQYGRELTAPRIDP